MTQLEHVIDVTIPFQKVTFVFGQPVDHLSENELFAALGALQAEIDAVSKQNENIGSKVIANRIEKLQAAKAEILAVLDADTAQTAPVAE